MKSNHGIENLVEKYDFKTHIKSISILLVILLSIWMYQLYNFSVATYIQISIVNYQLIDKKLDYSNDMIKSLTFLVWILQNNTSLF